MALFNCSECGKEISDKAGNCPNCGCPVQTASPDNYNFSENTLNPDIFNNTYVVNKKKKGGCLKFLIITFIALSIFIGLSSLMDSPNSTPDPIPASKRQSEFQSATGTTVEQEDKILNILSKCGINKIKSISHDELLDDVNESNETGYRLNANGVSNIILYLKEDKSVNKIRYADNDMYSDGEVKLTINDFIITSSEKSNLQISSQGVIESILKSPSTAKFPNINEWNIWKENRKIYIQSYVDSQNSFGAELRSEFQFILSADDLNVESLIFDGEEMINQDK